MNIHQTLMTYLNKTDYIPLVKPDMKQILFKRGMTFVDSSFKKNILAAVGRPAIMKVQRRVSLSSLAKLIVAEAFK